MRGFLIALSVGCALLGMASYTFASAISVSPLAADLNYQNRYQDIQVRNVGSDTAYVEVKVIRIDHSGQPNQTLVHLTDNPYQIGLIVTPDKIVIPEGQTRIVRALYVGQPPKKDVIYEVKIAPVTGELVALVSPKASVNAGVQVIIAYGVTLFVRPMQLHPVLTAVRHGTQLTLTNTGNTSVLLGSCSQCNAAATVCTPLKDLVKRLYPNNTATVTLPADGPLHCSQEVLQNQYTPFNIQ